jgi:AraC-like DNA-binding protein
MSDDTLHYFELAPPPALRPYVRCIWRMRGVPDHAAPPEPIIPDGCAELVLNFGDAFVRHSLDGSHRQPLRLVAGQITRAVTIQPSGVIDLWGVRFHPWGAAPFLGFSGAEMQGRLTSLDDAAGPLERELSDLGGAHSDETRYDTICTRLTRHLRRARGLERRLPRLIARIVDHHEPFTVRGLARDAGLSVRSVQLLFRDDVGLSPKQVHRIQRYQRALAIHRANTRLTWSAVATQAGYHDQAHLNHDSRDIAGCTPTELMGSPTGITEAFLSEDRPAR